MKRSNKWKIYILFSLFIFLSKFAYADNNLVIDNHTCYVSGEEVTFTISINNAPSNVLSYGLDLIYDEDVLEYKPQDTAIIKGELIKDFAGIIVGQPSSNTVRIGGYAGFEEIIDQGTSGDFLKLAFIVKNCQQSTLTLNNLVCDISGWTVKDGNLEEGDPNNIPPWIMDVPSGWSMISLPRLPDDTSVSSLFPNAVVVYGYEKGTGYIRTKMLEKGKGYWILLESEESYEFTGQFINESTQTVDENKWVMIGGCSFAAQASIDNGKIEVIYRYTPAGYQHVLESDNLLPGVGYWIFLSDIEEQATLRIEIIN